MTKLVEKAKCCLSDSDLDGFGKILDENWQLKRSLSSKISNTKIDDIYSIALKNRAMGGKILGAGGGGFLLFYCKKEHQKQLRGALSKLTEIEFNFEPTGSQLIYF
jgi:D-glycero-alpha-D-manno-heptose-7-phosphate kinase